MKKKNTEPDIIKLIIAHLDLSLPLDKIQIDCPLYDLGIDSENFIKLLALIESMFNISLKDISFLSPGKCTFKDIFKYIEEKVEKRKNQ